MEQVRQAKVITAKELPKLRYTLPESWKKAAGILKGKNIDPLEYQKKVRQEWEKRLKELERQVYFPRLH